MDEKAFVFCWQTPLSCWAHRRMCSLLSEQPELQPDARPSSLCVCCSSCHTDRISDWRQRYEYSRPYMMMEQLHSRKTSCLWSTCVMWRIQGDRKLFVFSLLGGERGGYNDRDGVCRQCGEEARGFVRNRQTYDSVISWKRTTGLQVSLKSHIYHQFWYKRLFNWSFHW